MYTIIPGTYLCIFNQWEAHHAFMGYVYSVNILTGGKQKTVSIHVVIMHEGRKFHKKTKINKETFRKHAKKKSSSRGIKFGSKRKFNLSEYKTIIYNN